MFANYSGIKPKGYVRYVDDIFCVFEDRSQIDSFFKFLNQLHTNLTFTLEIGIDSLPFLNTLIEIDGSNFNSSIYRKKTHTGVLMNFTAIVPTKWKFGLVLCLLNTAKVICSSEKSFWDEVSKLRKMFTLNNYPMFFFDKTLKRFLDKQNATILNTSIESNESSGITFSIPFIGEASHKFSKQMVNLIKATYNVDILPVFTSTKVGDFFSLKCKTPFPYSSNVVYKFSCLRDAGCSYIGQTKRHLVTRVNEHVDLKKLDQFDRQKSEIKNHIYDCSSCHEYKLGFNNFEILKRCQNSYNTKITEALCIKRLRPKLNKKLMTKGCSYLLKVF